MPRLCKLVRDELGLSVTDFAVLLGVSDAKVRLIESEALWGQPETAATRMQLELLQMVKGNVSEYAFTQYVQNTMTRNLQCKFSKAISGQGACDDDEV